MQPLVTIIIPTYNAISTIDSCLDSIGRLNYPKERLEIIISDAMSTDGTAERVLQRGYQVVYDHQKTVLTGRSVGFFAAKGELIAYTDADCIVEQEWLSRAIHYFNNPAVGGIGGPVLIPEDESPFGQAAAFVFNLAAISGGTRHVQNCNTTTEVTDLPGCNCIFRREALSKIFPPKLVLRSDDLWMGSVLHDLKYKLLFTPEVRMWHYHRQSFRQFFIQMNQYARNRVQAGRWQHTLLKPIHHIIGIALLVGIILLFLSILSHTIFILSIGLILFCIAILMTLAQIYNKSWKVTLQIPLAALVFVIAWPLGYWQERFIPQKPPL